mmetsp:Transcript_20316/g.60588  ORF Transcript_20316/g.60588 Transcript_20316/m.60588 type:complete len:243 (-) Transcript_20316:13-741(-)
MRWPPAGSLASCHRAAAAASRVARGADARRTRARATDASCMLSLARLPRHWRASAQMPRHSRRSAWVPSGPRSWSSPRCARRFTCSRSTCGFASPRVRVGGARPRRGTARPRTHRAAARAVVARLARGRVEGHVRQGRGDGVVELGAANVQGQHRGYARVAGRAEEAIGGVPVGARRPGQGHGRRRPHGQGVGGLDERRQTVGEVRVQALVRRGPPRRHGQRGGAALRGHRRGQMVEGRDPK